MPFTAEQKKEYNAKYWTAKKDGYNAQRRARHNNGFTLENELVNYIRKHTPHVDTIIKLGECPIKHFMNCKIEHIKRWLEAQFSNEMTWDNFGSTWRVHNIFSGTDMDHSSEKQAKMFNPAYLSPKRNDAMEERTQLWNMINKDACIDELPRDYAFEDDRTNEQEESIARITKEAEEHERRKTNAAKVLREKGCSEGQIAFVLSQDRYGAIAIMNKERLREWLSKKDC